MDTATLISGTTRAIEILGIGILIVGGLIAADIIGTVAIEPSLDSLAVLGVIVLIRTFLSFALEIEISGELPWRRVGGDAPHDPEQGRTATG